MKFFLFIAFFFISFISFSQNNHIVKTDDGRRVLLKADFTWEYIDTASSNSIAVLEPKKPTTCNVADDFKEPVLNKKIQAQLKKGRATINHVKKKVAKDFKCTENDVILLSVSEHKSKANYKFCANGTKVTYKRIGNTIIKDSKLF